MWDSFQIKYKLREAQARSALREMRFWESLSPEDQLYFHMPVKGFNSDQQLERDHIPDGKNPAHVSEDEDHSASSEEEYEEGSFAESDSASEVEALYAPEEDISKDYAPFA